MERMSNSTKRHDTTHLSLRQTKTRRRLLRFLSNNQACLMTHTNVIHFTTTTTQTAYMNDSKHISLK